MLYAHSGLCGRCFAFTRGVIVPFSRSNPFNVVVGRFLRAANPIFSIQEKIAKT